jgi:hypothetical protein
MSEPGVPDGCAGTTLLGEADESLPTLAMSNAARIATAITRAARAARAPFQVRRGMVMTAALIWCPSSMAPDR